MPGPDAAFWKKARQARDQLASGWLAHPGITMIDLGYDQDPATGQTGDRVVLRVHVKRGVARESLGLPAEVNGIPVRVIFADYQLE
jgi:hypothetical protein